MVQLDNIATAFSHKDTKALRKANFIFSLISKPFVSSVLTTLLRWMMFIRLPVMGMVRRTIFSHFCGGENIDQCKTMAHHLFDHNVFSVLDYSVEGKKTEESFDTTVAEIMKMLRTCRDTVVFPFCVFKMTGVVDAMILQKIQQNIPFNEEEETSFRKAKNRIETICQKAHAYGVQILVDAEDSWYQDAIDTILFEMMERYNKEKPIVHTTFQMYRISALNCLRRAYHKAEERKYFLGAKIVRGAYMEKERKRASKENYADPIHPSKLATDGAFNEAMTFCVDHIDRISLVCASHNTYSNEYTIALMKKKKIQNNDKRIWFLQLYGMSDPITFNLASGNYNVGKYVPYGPIRSVIPYLIRRAKENTSVVGHGSRELKLIRQELKRRRHA